MVIYTAPALTGKLPCAQARIQTKGERAYLYLRCPLLLFFDHLSFKTALIRKNSQHSKHSIPPVSRLHPPISIASPFIALVLPRCPFHLSFEADEDSRLRKRKSPSPGATPAHSLSFGSHPLAALRGSTTFSADGGPGDSALRWLRRCR